MFSNLAQKFAFAEEQPGAQIAKNREKIKKLSTKKVDKRMMLSLLLVL